MTKGHAVAGLVACASVVIAAPADAQVATRTTGALTGRVINVTGRGLPAVAVTIVGTPPSGARNTVTTASGRYRFSMLPPGQYAVRFQARNFVPVACERVGVVVNVIATLDVVMGRDGACRSADSTGSSSALATTFDARRLAMLSDTRDLAGLAAESPGVRPRADTDPNEAGVEVPVQVYGARAQHRSIIEGIVTELQPSPGTLSPNFQLFDQVSIETAAHSPAVPQAGLETLSISRSGSASYHGTMSGAANAPWRASNIDLAQGERGLRAGLGRSPLSTNRVERFSTTSADIGGFLKRNSSWWYFSIRDDDVEQQRPALIATPYRLGLFNYSGKGTFKTSASDLFIVYAQLGRRHEPTRIDALAVDPAVAVHRTPQSTSDRKDWSWVSKLEYRRIGDNVAIELRAGQFGYDWRDVPNGGGPRREDLATFEVFGGDLEQQRSPRRNQATAVVGRSSEWFGSHSLAAGIDVSRENAHASVAGGYVGGAAHVFNNGQPSEVYLVEASSASDAGLWTTSAYVNDTWRAGRITSALGLRVDRYRGFLPAQSHPASAFRPEPIRFAAIDNLFTWTLPSPRVGVAVDLTGQGRAVINASYATYWANPGINLASTVNPNAPVWWRRYGWIDTNTNGTWDVGEQRQLLATRGGANTETLDSGLRDAFTREFAMWLTARGRRVNLQAGYVWRGERQHYQRVNANQFYGAFDMPVSIGDPGPDGVPGTVDDGDPIVAYNLRPDLLNLPPAYVTRNVPGANSDYRTWEIVLSSQVSARLGATGTLTYTTSQDQGHSYAGNLVRENEFPVTPNDFVHTTTAGAYRFSTWSARVTGVYEAPFGIRMVPVLRYDEGQPFGRTLLTTLNYGTVTLLVEPMDGRRQRALAMLDFRLQKVFRLPRGGRLSGFVDVFNVLNANPEQMLEWRSGPSFLAPRSVAPPRTVRLGVRFDW